MKKFSFAFIVSVWLLAIVFMTLLVFSSFNYTIFAKELDTPTLDIKFNPTGTHYDSEGYLKIRLDFYPSEGDKSYEMHHILKPIIPIEGYKGKVDKEGNPVNVKDYNSWINGLPKEWVTNPALCHFVKVPRNITVQQLEMFVKAIFHSDVTTTIDDIIIKNNSIYLISSFMKDKSIFFEDKITENKETIRNLINDRLLNFNVINSNGVGELIPIETHSIDVGSPAIDRTSNNPPNYTTVTKENPVNEDGIIDTVEFYFGIGTATNVETASFYIVSGTNLSTRDVEDIGTVTSDSKQTFSGLDIDTLTGDYIGYYGTGAGRLEMDTTGGATGFYRKTGDYIPCTNITFSHYPTTYWFLSIYGIGEEEEEEFIPRIGIVRR